MFLYCHVISSQINKKKKRKKIKLQSKKKNTHYVLQIHTLFLLPTLADFHALFLFGIKRVFRDAFHSCFTYTHTHTHKHPFSQQFFLPRFLKFASFKLRGQHQVCTLHTVKAQFHILPTFLKFSGHGASTQSYKHRELVSVIHRKHQPY